MTAWTIDVPENLSDSAIHTFFSGWDWKDNPEGEKVILDFSNVRFVAPWAISLFASYGRWLQTIRSREVEVWIDHTTQAGKYLIGSGLPKILNIPEDNIGDLSADRFFPVSVIRTEKEIMPYVRGVMDMLKIEDPEMNDAMRYSMIELLRNVVQHSRSPLGATSFATYFPKTELTEIVIADTGCGIRASLRDRYPDISKDYKAVRFATQPHVSGTFSQGAYQSMLNNAGLGLFFIKEIVSRGCGGFHLASGDSIASHWGKEDGTPGKRYYSSRTGGWRGTFAVVQLRRGMIEQFGDLLTHCRDIASEVRRDPSELKLDFLDETPSIHGLKVVKVLDFDEDVATAAIIRDAEIIPSLNSDELVVLDFAGVRCATQSFIHALLYKVFRDASNVVTNLSFSNSANATSEAIRAVTAYARLDSNK